MTLWKTFGYASIEKKNILRFAGLAAKLLAKYYSPVTKPITEYSNIIVIFYQSHVLFQNCNM